MVAVARPVEMAVASTTSEAGMPVLAPEDPPERMRGFRKRM
jgi:hypothetical protein